MVAVVLLLGVFSSKLSSRFNVPILLMFLAVGMLTGSDGLGWVSINSTTHAGPINFLGTVAMCFILYSGGLDTNYRSIKGVLSYGALLASAGVLITALLVGLGAWLCSDMTSNGACCSGRSSLPPMPRRSSPSCAPKASA